MFMRRLLHKVWTNLYSLFAVSFKIFNFAKTVINQLAIYQMPSVHLSPGKSTKYFTAESVVRALQNAFYFADHMYILHLPLIIIFCRGAFKIYEVEKKV